MDLLKNCEQSENIKVEFKVLLKKYNEQLSNKNKYLKSQLQEKLQRNNDLKVKINELIYNNNVDTSKLVTDVVPNKSLSKIEGVVNRFKTNIDQVNKCRETIDTKFEEENKRMRKMYYEILNKNELALKPYYDVEEALKDLTEKTCSNIKKQKEDREIFTQYLKDRAQEFLQLKADIAMLEPIDKELKYRIKKLNENIEEKLKSLKLNCVEEACDKSPESKELLDDIDNLKSLLNKQ